MVKNIYNPLPLSVQPPPLSNQPLLFNIQHLLFAVLRHLHLLTVHLPASQVYKALQVLPLSLIPDIGDFFILRVSTFVSFMFSFILYQFLFRRFSALDFYGFYPYAFMRN